MYLDLTELDQVFDGRWFWTTRPARFAGARPARFAREDHVGDPGIPLHLAIRELVETRIGIRPAGPIRLLTHLRYMGFLINPVSFYYCFDAAGVGLEAIVAEVTNTPWGERHCYVLDPRARAELGDAPARSSRDDTLHFRHPKELHVSPFMTMDHEYRWRIRAPGSQIEVRVANHRGDECLFDATLELERREIGTATLCRMLMQYPFMTLRVFTAIYRQALCLWWKGVPFVPHPSLSNHRQPSLP
jgi:uncharacterized protein